MSPHRGCKVTGYRRTATGQPGQQFIRFTPEHGGRYQGSYYGAETCTVLPDKDGKFEVVLVPSIAVGPYVVDIGPGKRRGQRETVTIVVPEASEAIFDSIIQRT